MIDFSFDERSWGNNFQLCNKLDKKGFRWEIAIWYKNRPNIGEKIHLGLSKVDTRHAFITEVNPCGDPHDMYFIKVKIGKLTKIDRLKMAKL